MGAYSEAYGAEEGGVKSLDEEALLRLLRAQAPVWTAHARREADAEFLLPNDVTYALEHGITIVEDYPNSPRGAACLVLAHLEDGRPVHVVMGYSVKPPCIVTVYRPDLQPHRWSSDFRSRRRW